MKRPHGISEEDMFGYLSQKKDFDGLRLANLRHRPRLRDVGFEPDCFLTFEWEGKRKEFVVELRSRSTPSAVYEAAARARFQADRLGTRLPMIVVPYLSPGTYDRLLHEGVSALDMCGNGIVHVKGEWYVRHTGEPNRYRESAPVRNAYRGAASLVGRVLLLRPEFELVTDIRDEIERRGGEITLGTVSKALKALEEDLVVSRSAGVRLLQGRKLLDALADNYAHPPRARVVTGRAEDLVGALNAVATNAARAGVKIAAHDPARYVTYESAVPQALAYVSSLDAILENVPFEETKRFANLTIVETPDTKVFFDLRPTNSPNAEAPLRAENVLWTSPVEVYLELATGDGRARETAARMVAALLEGRYE